MYMFPTSVMSVIYKLLLRKGSTSYYIIIIIIITTTTLGCKDPEG